jgi:hypothetical protein
VGQARRLRWGTGMSRLLDEPAHWRQRAEQMVAMAKTAPDAAAKETMLSMAAEYEKLAQRAEARLAATLKQMSGQ